MTLPYLAGSKWRHKISGYPNRGGTLAVAARSKEVGQALGPQRLRPAGRSGLRRAPRPAEPQRDLASVFGRTLTVFEIWPSPGSTRGHRIFAPSVIVLDSCTVATKARMALRGVFPWLACPLSPPVLKEMTTIHTTCKHQESFRSSFSVNIWNIGASKQTSETNS